MSKTTVYEKKANGTYFPLGQVVPNIDERVRKLEQFPGSVVVTPPVISGSLTLPIGIPVELEVSASSLLVDGVISKFEYYLDDGEVQSVVASSGSTTITVEIPEGTEGDTTFQLTVTAYDSYGSRNSTTKTITAIVAGVATPSLSGKTTDFIAGSDTFTGSEFTMIGLEGNHDKSDWVIYKKDFPSVEIWSSRDDTEHLTESPNDLRDVLEISTTYIIKVRYHDSVNDIWSDYGELEFVTAAVFMMPWEINVKTRGIHFIANSTGNNVALFSGSVIPDGCKYAVYINDELTDQSYDNLSFNTDDNVLITVVTGDKFPKLRCDAAYVDYKIKKFTEPLPLMCEGDGTPTKSLSKLFWRKGGESFQEIPDYFFSNNPEVTDLSYVLSECPSLRAIPENIFKHNTKVTNFASCFSKNSALTTVPENLFANNPEVTSFENLFFECSALTTVPENLFANNPEVTSFAGLFQGCTALEAIPGNIFKNKSKVTSINQCFNGCSSLVSIPEGLFASISKITSLINMFSDCSSISSVPINLLEHLTNLDVVNQCFYNCSSVTPIVRIRSLNIKQAGNFCNGTKSKGTVYVPSGSTTASSFKSSINTNVNIIEE